MKKKPVHRRIASMSGAEELKSREQSRQNSTKKIPKSKRPNVPLARDSELLFTDQGMKKTPNKSRQTRAGEIQGLLRQREEQIETCKLKHAAEVQYRDSIILSLFERQFKAPPTFFKTLNEFTAVRRVEFADLCAECKIGDYVDLDKMAKILETQNEFKDLFPEGVPFETMNLLYEKFQNCSSEKESAVEEVLHYIALCLQLHRIPKAQVAQLIVGKRPGNEPISAADLRGVLQKTPFKVMNEQSLSKICEFLKEPTANKVAQKLIRNLEDWTIFTNDQEEEFDKQLYILISKYKVDFRKLCEACDPESTGIITKEQLGSVYDQMGIALNDEINTYLSLLFFSYSYDIHKVPYQHFIKSYSQPIEDFELEEEEKASVVRNYLEIIAEAMIKKSLTIKTGFKSKGGYIYPDDFLRGLIEMGANEFSEDALVLLVESLQCDGIDEACISLEELEELFEYYGVGRYEKPEDLEFKSL